MIELKGRTGRRMFMGTPDEKKAFDWWKQEFDYHRNGKKYMLGDTEVYLSGLGYSMMHQADLSLAHQLRRQGWGEGAIRMVDARMKNFEWTHSTIFSSYAYGYKPLMPITKEDKEAWVLKATRHTRR